MTYQEWPTVSVVIPVKSSPGTIRDTVESLVRQDYPGKVEVIVVGDPGDPTWDPIGNLIEAGKVRAIEVDHKLHGKDTNLKRTIGLARANGDVLALTDSDVVLPSHWIATGIQLIQAGWHCVCGSLDGVEHNFWSTYIDSVDVGSKTPRFSTVRVVDKKSFGRGGHKPPITANTLFTRDVYSHAGGFDPSFIHSYDDYEWFWRIAKAGYSLLCTPALKAGHHHRQQNLPALVREYVRSGRGCGDFVLAYPDCPFSRKRLAQLAAVLTAAFSLLLPTLALPVAAAALLGLGFKNVVKARRVQAVFFPLITLMFGLAFSYGMASELFQSRLSPLRPHLRPPHAHATETVVEITSVREVPARNADASLDRRSNIGAGLATSNTVASDTGTARQDIVRYLTGVGEVVTAVPSEPLAEIVELILAAGRDGRTVFSLGNGGSAATASHLACDLAKTASVPGHPRLRALALSDNVPLLTAWGNDSSYDVIFAEQVRTLVRAQDLVVAISASGNSPNVLAAAEAAREIGACIIGVTGFGGGRLQPLCDVCLVVPSHEYGPVEDAHMIAVHAITAAIRAALEARPVATPQLLHDQEVLVH